MPVYWTVIYHSKARWILYVPTGFDIKNSTFCPHSAFMCFVWIWEQTAIISLYSIDWLVCITETECVYCAVRTGSLYIILRSAHTAYLCFVWIWEQTAIISLYSINWLVCITETECVYCAVRTGSRTISIKGHKIERKYLSCLFPDQSPLTKPILFSYLLLCFAKLSY